MDARKASPAATPPTKAIKIRFVRPILSPGLTRQVIGARLTAQAMIAPFELCRESQRARGLGGE